MKLFEDISAFIVQCKNGWCTEEKAHALAAAVLTLRPEVCVEIGVFAGKSFFPVALALKHVGRGVITGIDPWDQQASAEGQMNENLKWWGTLDHDYVFREFQRLLLDTATLKHVNFIREKSDDVKPPPRIDLLHLDGNHSDQAIRDVDRFAPSVRVGGLVFMDDIGWEGGGVLRACAKLKGMGFAALYEIDTGAMFQKVA